MKVKFEAVVEVPDGTPLKDVEDWIRFEIGATGSLEGNNAMVHTDILSAGCRNVYVREV